MISVEDFRRHAREWMEQADIPEEPLDLDARFRVLRQWQKELFEAGFMGIHWPADAGGQDLTVAHHLAFSEELARALAPTPIGLIGLEVVGPSIVDHGTPEQRARLLPPLLSGDEIWCQGFSEPDAGSDLAALRTKAVLDGDTFVVSGQKVWTSWAHVADWCAVLVRTDPEAAKHRGISYLLVPMDLPGITVQPLIQITGDAEFNEVFFEEVRVPRANLLGELNQGWAIAMHTLSHERSSYSFRRRIDHELMFRHLLRDLRRAQQQGVSFPEQVLSSLGAAYLALRTLEAQMRGTLQRLTAHAGPSSIDSADKLLVNDVEQLVTGTAFDILGPSRVVDGAPYGLSPAKWTHSYLFGRAASVYGGSTQIQRNILAERELGLPKE